MDFLFPYARWLDYSFVRVQNFTERENVFFISVKSLAEISVDKTAKTPIESGFSWAISFL